MTQNRRPSSREKINKVKSGLDAVRENRRLIAEDKHLAMSYDFLAVTESSEFWIKMEELLVELKSFGPDRCYAGGHPPQRSYETGIISNQELWAYAWDSSIMGCRVYLKFCLVSESRTGEAQFYFVDCHESQN